MFCGNFFTGLLTVSGMIHFFLNSIRMVLEVLPLTIRKWSSKICFINSTDKNRRNLIQAIWRTYSFPSIYKWNVHILSLMLMTHQYWSQIMMMMFSQRGVNNYWAIFLNGTVQIHCILIPQKAKEWDSTMFKRMYQILVSTIIH